MKKTLTVLFVFAFVVAFTNRADAQPFKLGFFTGYGMSSFEGATENAGTIPVGLQALYALENMDWGALNFGVEFNYGAVPFTYEFSNAQGKLFDQKYSQMAIAALVKVKFMKKSTLRPFARVGGGLYTGNIKLEYTDLGKQALQAANQATPDEIKLDSGFGFNIGAGTDYVLDAKGKSALFFEFVFHIVSRTADGASASRGFNNWAIQAGYQLSLGN